MYHSLGGPNKFFLDLSQPAIYFCLTKIIHGSFLIFSDGKSIKIHKGSERCKEATRRASALNSTFPSYKIIIKVLLNGISIDKHFSGNFLLYAVIYEILWQI